MPGFQYILRPAQIDDVVASSPYMPGIDGHHNVWMNLQGSDRLAKFDPRTAHWDPLRLARSRQVSISWIAPAR